MVFYTRRDKLLNQHIQKLVELFNFWNSATQGDSQVNNDKIKETLIVKDLPKNQVYICLSGGFDKVNVVNFIGGNVGLMYAT